MADVVKNERPDLAELRANLVVQIAQDKAREDSVTSQVTRNLKQESLKKKKKKIFENKTNHKCLLDLNE